MEAKINIGKLPTQKNGASKTGFLSAEEWTWIHLSLDTKSNSKGIKDLNVNPEILKLLEKNKGYTFQELF